MNSSSSIKNPFVSDNEIENEENDNSFVQINDLKISKYFQPLFKNSILHLQDFTNKHLLSFFCKVKTEDKNQLNEITNFMKDNKEEFEFMIEYMELIKKSKEKLLIPLSELDFSLKEQFDNLILKEYSFHLFEFFNILNIMVSIDMVSDINEFFASLSFDEIEYFFNIPLIYSNNIFLTRIYFSFLLTYRSGIKNSQVNFNKKLY